MDDAAIAMMARMDNIRDDVVDLKLATKGLQDGQGRHDNILESLTDSVGSIASDITDIKKGPVYSLDRFITLRVAQTTGGLGLFGIALAFVLGFF